MAKHKGDRLAGVFIEVRPATADREVTAILLASIAHPPSSGSDLRWRDLVRA